MAEMNNTIWLSAELKAGCKVEASGEKIPTFSMFAYAGNPITVGGWDAPVVINLKKCRCESQTIPVRLDHDAKKGVGHTTSVVCSDDCITAEGVISRKNIFAEDVAQSAKNGFPWKCSVGGSVSDFVFLREGSVDVVNGRQVAGPLYIAEFNLQEISFVDAGADPLASAVVSARKDEKMTEEKKNLEASGELNEQNENNVLCAGLSDGEVKARQDEMVARINAAAAENLERINKIREIGKDRFPELQAQAIKENWNPDKFELEMLRKGTPSDAPNTTVQAGRVDSRVLEAAALLSGGMPGSIREKMFDEKTLEAADKYSGIGLRELCSLVARKELPDYRRDPRGWLYAAFSTADISNVLSNIANKSALASYEGTDESWRKVCSIGSVNDFKEHTRVRLLTDLNHTKLAPGGKIEHGTIGDMKFGQKADTYAVAFGFDRQMMYNDDLGLLVNLAAEFGRSASRRISETVWTRILSNPTQADNKAFFHANHGNLFTGSTTALSYSALTAAEANYLKLKTPSGAPLGIFPKVLLVPTDLYGLAQTLVKSQTLNDGTAAPTGTYNIHFGKFDVVASPYLSNSAISGYSATAWYLLASPSDLAAFEVAFLGGKQYPSIQSTDADFDTLGINFRSFIDFGFREQDPLGAIKMAGA